MSRLAVIPAAPGLLSAYAGRIDPLAEVRAVVEQAVAWLTADAEVVQVVCVRASQLDRARGLARSGSERIATELFAGFTGELRWSEPDDFVVDVPTLLLADGSARRGEKAPGHLDERGFEFDAVIERALGSGEADPLAKLDQELGEELLVGGAVAFRRLGELDLAVAQANLDYAADPFGVRYWVARWSLTQG
ncbi:hypothetical protein ACLM5J_02110 [Nocardioides sp. Bht2]|uniref:hypothetical protein n=1 Tax=Nocardioides sp. Bht2 TaxID=3392297 RepID=UPI0039B38C3D